MSITLTLENAPTAQAETQKVFHGGQLVIGRGDECDWRLDDPEKYVSRRHCIVTDESGTVSVIDASSGGLFVDGAGTALGNGNACPLEDEMRLRLGDFVIRIEMSDAKAKDATTAPQKDGFFDFGTPDPDAHKTEPRPDDLPDPFGMRSDSTPGPFDDEDDTKDPLPLDQRDPFALDLNQRSVAEDSGGRTTGGGGYFDSAEPDKPSGVVLKPDFDTDDQSDPDPVPPIEVTLDPARQRDRPVLDQTGDPNRNKVQITPAGEHDVIAALYRGLGLSEEEAREATLEEVEAVGARLRDSIDGLMFLLRTRAQEKQKIRVAQTIIANSNVNPLKFLASTDEAILALIRGRDASYLPGDKAVTQAYRDLADHQIRTWQALQAALRRIIDRFDPEEVERELEETGFLEKIVAGGSSAKMWQLYQERYRDIAKSAEERFLGEVGADFRDAYETKGS